MGTPFVGELGFRDPGVRGRVGDAARRLAAGIVDLMGDDAAWRSAATQGRLLASAARWTSVTEPAERLYRRWIGTTAANAGATSWLAVSRRRDRRAPHARRGCLA